jgi:hypothetical protein
MSGPAPPVSPTSQLAESIPGFDATPVIAAGEQRLTDYLAMPTHQIMNQFGVHGLPDQAAAAAAHPQMPGSPGNALNALNPAQLISPVTNALGTLGSGQFPDMNPTSMLNGISNAFGNTAGPLQQAMGAVEQGWQGASSAAAGTKTTTALANGAEVATQATGLQNSLTAAAADVGQARTQLIEIVNEFVATVQAIGPMIIFPWGWAAVLAAAAKAVSHGASVMTELQSSLAAQATNVTAIGSPVSVTAASQLGAAPASAVSSLLGSGSSLMSPASAMNMLSPAMSAATAGISPAMSAASAAGAVGNPAAAGATSATLAGATAEDTKAAGGAAAGLKGGGSAPLAGGGAPGAALASRLSAPAAAAASETAVATTSLGAGRPSAAGMAMGGTGMMGAPMAGASHAGAGGAHTAASFLTTSDQGGKVVGNRSTVAPPVIGETDPNDTPDIELRI